MRKQSDSCRLQIVIFATNSKPQWHCPIDPLLSAPSWYCVPVSTDHHDNFQAGDSQNSPSSCFILKYPSFSLLFTNIHHALAQHMSWYVLLLLIVILAWGTPQSPSCIAPTHATVRSRCSELHCCGGIFSNWDLVRSSWVTGSGVDTPVSSSPVANPWGCLEEKLKYALAVQVDGVLGDMLFRWSVTLH